MVRAPARPEPFRCATPCVLPDMPYLLSDRAAAGQPQPTAHRLVQAALACLMTLAALAIQLAWMNPAIDSYDEGLMLVGADRVLQGDVPYRDFWTLYGPGGFYSLAGLFEVFGETAWVGRVFDAAAKTAIVAFSYFLVLYFGRRSLALIGATLTLGLMMYLKSYGAPIFSALAAALAAVLALSRLATTGSWQAAATAGVATGVTLLIRHDVGLYTLVAEVMVMWRLGHGDGTSVGTERSRRIWLAFASALAIIVTPAVVLLLVAVPVGDLYRDLIDIAIFIYPQNRSLPFPPVDEALREALERRSMGSLAALLVYVPILAVVIAAAGEWWRWNDRRRAVSRVRGVPGVPGGASELVFQMLILLSALYFLKGLVRVSPLHMGPSLVTSIVLLSASAARARSRLVRKTLSGIAALALALVILKPLIGAGGSRNAASIVSGRWLIDAADLCSRRALPRLRCMTLDPSQLIVAEWLLSHGSRGHLIYVGPGRHDKIFANDLAIYFAAESTPATKWHDSHPGVQTTLDVQRFMIGELRSKPVKYVVLDRVWDDLIEPNASARSSGVTVFDDFVRSHFAPVFASGTLTVLAPNDSATINR